MGLDAVLRRTQKSTRGLEVKLKRSFVLFIKGNEYPLTRLPTNGLRSLTRPRTTKSSSRTSEGFRSGQIVVGGGRLEEMLDGKVSLDLVRGWTKDIGVGWGNIFIESKTKKVKRSQ